MTLGHPFDDDKLREECGVFGVWGHKDAPEITALGLHALQHRGQESCGIVAFNGKEFSMHRGLGQVGDVFSNPEVMAKLNGKAAIGHNRYSTTGDTTARNAQPIFADLESGGFALAHNGNLTNAAMLRRQLVSRGAIFQTTTDTEVIIHLVALARSGTVVERLIEALRQVVGAYSIVAQTNDMVIGVRDPFGVRPLVLGKLEDGYILASESCALDIIGAAYVREIEPGELVILDASGIKSLFPFQKQAARPCIFENIYFSRPDSRAGNFSVYEIRKAIGRELAREAPPPEKENTVVIPVPDSGVPAAIGYATEAGLPFELGITRNHYIGRTFIEPTQQIRNLGVRLKHNPNSALLRGKNVVLVDDSLVRGTTSRKIVEMVRNTGAKSVHFRISSPPTKHSCFYGIDTPEQEQLMAYRMNVDEIRSEIGADTLAYISMDGLYRSMGEAARDAKAPKYCDACFTGDYPLSLIDRDAKNGDKVTFIKERQVKS